MDRSWITLSSITDEYQKGLNEFLDFAFQHVSGANTIICPCKHCKFKKRQIRDIVYDHLTCTPFPRGYTFWFRHGEIREGESSNMLRRDPMCDTENHVRDNDEPIRNMLYDAFGEFRHSRRDEPLSLDENITADAKTFYDLLKDGEELLYDGCANFTKLSFLVRMYHIKCLYGISAEAMNMFFELLSEAFEFAKISKSFYEAKKVIKKLGLTYTKIDMYPNDCMLYWAEDENKGECNKCKTSR